MIEEAVGPQTLQPTSHRKNRSLVHQLNNQTNSYQVQNQSSETQSHRGNDEEDVALEREMRAARRDQHTIVGSKEQPDTVTLTGEDMKCLLK